MMQSICVVKVVVVVGSTAPAMAAMRRDESDTKLLWIG
jgi:hypothetical protein